MGTKNMKGSVAIDNNMSGIRLRWRFQSKRYSIYIAAYTKQSLLQAKKVAVQIEHDIATGQFDYTLNTYKPSSREVTPVLLRPW